MAIMKDSDVSGKRVILEDASDVGVLIDIYVDTLDWRITKFDIRIEKRYAERLGREKGFLKKPVISAPIHLLKSVGDVVHLKGSIDDLAKTQKAILPSSEVRKEMEMKAAASGKPGKPGKPAKPGKPGKPGKAPAGPAGEMPAPPPPMPPKKEEKKEKPRSL